MTAQEKPTPVHAFADDALSDHDATALAALIRQGKLSPRDVVAAAIQRARRVEPLIHGLAFADFEDALHTASRRIDGIFAGVPTLIKDNTNIAGQPTRHGSLATTGKPEKSTSPFAHQLLAQGLIPLGKSTLPEFGFNASTEPAHAEPTRNPWNPAFSCGASSGGSAALVAAGVVPIAHANDGGGSIRIPAACCGLVGLKPTRGRLVANEAGRVLPINIISEGVVTRSVRDTARFFAGAEHHYHNPHLPAIGEVLGPAKRRLRIGLVMESITASGTENDTKSGTDEVTRHTVDATARLLESLGHTIIPMDVPVPRQFAEDFAHYWAFLAFIMRKGGKQFLGKGFDPTKVDGLTRGLSSRFTAGFQRLPATLWRLRQTRFLYAQGLENFGVDAVLSPVLAHTTPPLGYLSPELPFDTLFQRLVDYVSFTPLANAAGVPAISLPMGTTPDNLPVGVHISAHHGCERDLLELAFELEQAAPWRRIQR
ncbi:amidase [Marinobacter fonticola]|uniref:amidase n=1 Tax=Marinobacter fonticola TaxID=2603215 RepID=UPI0011E6F9C7|nr:amidase [Marinobacter fonticola]